MRIRTQRVERAGWSVGLRLTARGGMVLRDVTFHDQRVLQSASTPFVYVDYVGQSIGAFTDHLGTTTAVPEVRPTVDGFDIAVRYDAAGPDYLYEHIWRFFGDGQFGCRMVVHGPGEEHSGGHTYFVPFRLDIDCGSGLRDSVDAWFGPPSAGTWSAQSTEGELLHAPRSRWDWSVVDRAAGRRVLLRATDPAHDRCWAVRYRPEESFGALGVIQPGAPGTAGSVPVVYVGDESLQDSDVVLWYVAQVNAMPYVVTCGPWLGLQGY